LTTLGVMLAMGQVPDSARWTIRAIQDTTAAIAGQAAYRRQLTSSWLDRLGAWLFQWLDRLFTPLGTINLSHLILYLAGGLLILLGAQAIVSARAEGNEWGGRHRRGSIRRGRDPWIEAKAFASAGDFTSASHALYAALLTRLAGRGAIRLHPSKTAGDYARELRRRGAPEQRPFQAFRYRYDRLIYGTGACTSEDYAALVVDAGVILERTA
jgi:Domain of unknown function (DUF4129)